MANNKPSNLPADLVDVTQKEALPDDLEDVTPAAALSSDDTPASAQTPPQRTFYVRAPDGELQPVSYDDAFLANAKGLKVFSEDEARALFSGAQQAVSPFPSAVRMSQPTEPVGAGETFLNRAVNAVPLAHPVVDMLSTGAIQAAKALGVGEPGAKLTPRAELELEAQGENVRQSNRNSLPNAINTYRQMRDTRNLRTAEGSEEKPWAGRLGTALGIGLSALAPLPKAMPKGSGLRSAAMAGAKTGAGYGALTGLTEGPADLTRGELGQALKDTVIGGTIGAGLGATLPVALQGGWKARALTGGGLGAGYGAAQGLTDDKATAGDTALKALEGGAVGATAAVGLPMALGAVRGLWNGYVKPIDAAKYLREKGVPLTTGQMNPEGKLAQLEEISSSAGGFGQAVKGQRDVAREGWQDVVLNEARPPGMPPLPAGKGIPERLTQAYEGFEEAYAPARGVMVTPKTADGTPLVPPTPPPAPPPEPRPRVNYPKDAKGRFLPRDQWPPDFVPPPPRPKPPPVPPKPPEVQGAFEKAVADPSVLATDAERGVVRKFLDNELSLINKEAKEGLVSSDALLKMRSNIRAAMAKAAKGERFPEAELLSRAEEQLTGTLETGLPEKALNALRAADTAYAKYKPVEATVARAGDMPDGFTPAQLSQTLRQEMEKGAYARGGGGELRELAKAGRATLDARIPKTGVQALAKIPIIGSWGGAPLSYAANLPGPQRFLLGETGLQRGMSSMESKLGEYLNRAPTEAGVRPLFSGTPEQQRKLMEQRALADFLMQRASAKGQ